MAAVFFIWIIRLKRKRYPIESQKFLISDRTVFLRTTWINPGATWRNGDTTNSSVLSNRNFNSFSEYSSKS